MVDEKQSDAYVAPRPFIVTKVWRSFHGYEDTKLCLRQSFKRLFPTPKTGVIDLVLVHWPGPGYKTINRSHEMIRKHGVGYYFKEGHEDYAALRLETWRALEDVVLATNGDDDKTINKVRVRSIGVSNFSISHLTKLLEWKDLRISPAVNQIEMHPYYPQTELRQFCQDHGIVVQAYSSLGGQDYSKNDYDNTLKRPPLLQNPVVLEVARVCTERCEKTRDDENDSATSNDRRPNFGPVTPAQVLLRWALQHGATVIPKTSSEERLLENRGVFSFELDDAQMAALDDLDCGSVGRLTWRRDPMRDLEFD